MDYDPPWIHEHKIIRKVEQKLHLDFFWARNISRIVEKQGYEAVVSMSERIAVPLGHWLNSRVKHVAIIINTVSPKWLLALKVLKTYQKWDKIVTYSHAEAEALQRELRLAPGKIHTILNYVDTNFFKPTEKHDPEQNDHFIMSQGLAWRDYPTLIRAMRQLPHINCHISAKSAWDDFSAGYEGLEIPENVHIKSYDHPYCIREIFSKCRFVVIPLRPKASMWCSGSTSVLQSQAMGKPIIVSHLPGIAEYVKDGETGFVVEGNNPIALAEAIDYLWQNPQKAEDMGQQGQLWVRENFSLENWVNKMNGLLENLA
jgi:glycosyltransferase involved in cell wall biosynthesis